MGLKRIISKLLDKKISFSINYDDASNEDKVMISIHTEEGVMFCVFENGEVAWHSEKEYIKILKKLI